MNVLFGKINTTIGERYVVVGGYKSKEFKTFKGAMNYISKNGYKIVKSLDD